MGWPFNEPRHWRLEMVERDIVVDELAVVP